VRTEEASARVSAWSNGTTRVRAAANPRDVVIDRTLLTFIDATGRGSLRNSIDEIRLAAAISASAAFKAPPVRCEPDSRRRTLSRRSPPI
jgi:hypothetical protein